MWSDEKTEEIKNKLKDLSEEKYRNFHSSLLPGVKNILGVRMPLIKKIAREIAKDDWRGFFTADDEGIYEMKMLKGLSVAFAKCNAEEKIQYLERFIPLVDNWAICDCVCGSLKPKKEEEQLYFDFAAAFAQKEGEYEARVGIVLLMDCFFTEEWIDKSLEVFKKVHMGKYYTDMGFAWALSMGLVKFEEKTIEFMENNKLSDFVYNKALQKARESYRVSEDKKAVYRRMQKERKQQKY